MRWHARGSARHLAFLVVAAVAVAGCRPSVGSPTESGSPTTTRSPAEGGTCVEFEAPLAVGDEFGASAGHSPGDVAFTEAGIPVAVVDFAWVPSGGTFNVAQVQSAPAGFGSGQVVFLNNINFEFDFTALGFTPGRVELAFLDQGGHENLAVNDDPSPPHADEFTAMLGSVTVTVIVSASGAGTATFNGPVEPLLIGGQEFSLDHVCAHE